MRSIQLHVPSVAIGVASLALLLISMGQAVPLIGPPRIEYGPNPHDYIQIKEGTPYTVPAGRLFMLTALGQSDNSGLSCALKVNGQQEVASGTLSNGAPGGLVASLSVLAVAPGFTVPAGSTIEVDDLLVANAKGRAWGYLAPQ